MRVRYFQDTDAPLVEWSEEAAPETRDLDEDTILDIDQQGNIGSITMEHASTPAGAPHFSHAHIAAA